MIRLRTINVRFAAIICIVIGWTNSVVSCRQLFAQTPKQKAAIQTSAEPKETVIKSNLSDAELLTFAISLVISLATDARSYSDLALRPRVMARAADVLWDADNVTARALFKRAWEAAEKGDAEEVTIKTKDSPPAMVQGLRRMSGRDLRFEVLREIARRDQVLAEEYFARLKLEKEPEAAKDSAPHDDWFVPAAVSKRLQVASELLDKGETEKALEFATPVLTQVNVHTIGFLSKLRTQNSAAADRVFTRLLARTEMDPAADANTVSGLSSYVFTPGLYVSFNPEGGVRWQQPDEPFVPAPDFPAVLRDKFFQVAAGILLRPLPPPDPQLASSPRTVKRNVINRLLPLFEQYAPDTAAALRAQVMELTRPGSDPLTAENFMLTQGIKPEPDATDTLERMQSKIDRARTARERDSIYAGAAAALLAQGDESARDIAEKIEDPERRTQIRQHVDFEFIQRAIKKKASSEAIRLAQTGKISNTQRAIAYIEVARLVREAEPQRAVGLLEDAVREINRIEGDKPDRAVLLLGVANQLFVSDRVRAWEIMDQEVKEANRMEGYSGETMLTFPLMTSTGVKFTRVGGENFSLTNAFKSLAKDDLYRAVDLAKSFKYDAARATVTLAIARSILQK